MLIIYVYGAGLIREVDLSYNTNLRLLKIHELTLYQVSLFMPSPTFLTFPAPTVIRVQPFQWLVPLLATLDSPDLQEIMLGIWLSAEPQLELLDWQALVAIFTKPLFKELRQIRVEVSGMAQGTDEAQKWLASKIEMSRELIRIEFSDT